ncbi:uncharacterized protein LOC116264597 isoform X2 [Nymphaea colorata]|uniref:uncharacterized protein LOC116264597 isoform X2 n=1 Tax=Nymphaea colorata TaxID=210225 RepID=UPI00214E3C4E|nr:uncharacterized protein LOC116264597 isoform X2 [Nymphaea colorata]
MAHQSSLQTTNLRLQRNSLPSPITIHRAWAIASALLFPFLPFLAMPGSFLDAGEVEDIEFQNSPNVIQQLRVQVIKAGFCEDQHHLCGLLAIKGWGLSIRSL